MLLISRILNFQNMDNVNRIASQKSRKIIIYYNLQVLRRAADSGSHM